MTPHQQSILSRYGISNPPEWSGMSGQGADTLYSVGGKWMKAGQTHPSGYTIGQYDPKSKALGMSIHGVNIPVGMKSSTIQNFEAPYNPYEDPTAQLSDIMSNTESIRKKLAMAKLFNSQSGAEIGAKLGSQEAMGSQEAIKEEILKETRKRIMNGGTLSDFETRILFDELKNLKKVEQDYQ